MDYKNNLIKEREEREENINKFNIQKFENESKLKNRIKQFKNKENNIKNKKLIEELEREIQ